MTIIDRWRVSDTDVETFQRDGVVVLRNVFTDWVEPLREGIRKLMTDPSPMERSVVPQDGSAPFFQDLCNWQRIPEFTQFVLHSNAGALGAGLMRSNSARFFHDHVLVKQPGGTTVTPWHQDQPYYCVDGKQSVSFWIPLDPVARNVVMECVRGSHLWGEDFRPMRFDGTPLYENDNYEGLPDINAHRDEFDIAGWDMQPGDAIAFNFRTVHGAPGNPSNIARRVFSARWVGDDAVYVDRDGKGSPPIKGLPLRDGEAFDAPIFPVVWRDGAQVS
ncbi:phytanoyl-CoA dioxygenase family protein [Paenalcaligenes niemegkensis]|uniref:phytanoyl-CoA dioxygenase family protein n=1 Tax=Paenalcaligenes niemegkensis TaxID=2895469 RepID=UPI001EE8FA43|nr:phytanoyl-CoA dioxygenase family protein [Paenalcaligenes niemegkensis]MCQ9615739.1 phytanoyl-CoA dioxygenase family protein [Paenalcaligenes niemegkensis]